MSISKQFLQQNSYKGIFIKTWAVYHAYSYYTAGFVAELLPFEGIKPCFSQACTMDLHKLQLYTPMAFPGSVLEAFSEADFADCSSCRAINLAGECPLNAQGGFLITLALPGFQKPCQVNNSRTPQPSPAV